MSQNVINNDDQPSPKTLDAHGKMKEGFWKGVTERDNSGGQVKIDPITCCCINIQSSLPVASSKMEAAERKNREGNGLAS